MKNIGTFFLLHIVLMLYSLEGIVSKTASAESFLSVRFIGLYAVTIIIMGIYAIAWQQIIKRMPLTTAYANKAVTVVWGIVWGFVFFQEAISFTKIIGAIILIIGVVLFEIAENQEQEQ